MKTIYILLTLLIFTILYLQPVLSQEKGVKHISISSLPSNEKRWALLIGVDTYQKDISPLYGTVNDAKALREALLKYAGFADERIILMTTDSTDQDLVPTRGNIFDQLDKLSRVVPEDGLLLFSFSGHGISIGNDAFIVPSDGRIYQNVDLMRERAIDVLRIKHSIQTIKVKQVIMFLDACRNDPLRAKGEADNDLTASYTKGFSFDTRNENIEAYATLYATSFGDRAYEFLDKKTKQYRGYFSYAIEEGLKGAAANDKGEITLEGLIRYVQETVKQRVRINENQRQIPYPTIDGFGNDLVVAVANKSEGSSLSSAQIAWENFRGVAKSLLKYDEIMPFSEGLAAVKLNEKIGFIDRTGKEVIAVKFEETAPGKDNSIEEGSIFSEGLSAVKSNGKWGFIDKTGKTIIYLKPGYKALTEFKNGFAQIAKCSERVGDGEKYETCLYGIIDKTGKEIIPLKYEEISDFKNNGFVARADCYLYFFDNTGKIIKQFQHDGVEFSEGEFFRVFMNGQLDLIDESGNIVMTEDTLNKMDAQYNILNFKSMRSGFFAFGDKNTKKIGMLDLNGNIVISPKYDSPPAGNDLYYRFIGGFAFVISDGKKGFIDKTGREIISPIYKGNNPIDLYSILFQKYGLMTVKLNNKVGLYDKTGKEVIAPGYDDIDSLKKGFVRVKLNNSWGIVTDSGKEVVSPKYDDKFWCIFQESGFFGITLNGKKGFVDIYGNEYFDF